MGSEDIKQARAALRTQAREARAEMDPLQRAFKSSDICDQLKNALEVAVAMSGRAAEDCTVAVYAAFPEEVDLDRFIQAAYALGCKVAFPCMMHDARSVSATEQTMEMRVVDAASYAAGTVPFIEKPLRRFHNADAELTAFPYVPADELTMLVVPMVAFDAEYSRLGYGKGNYDRYLTQREDMRGIVGAAFAEQQVDAIPTEEFDIPLPAVIRA